MATIFSHGVFAAGIGSTFPREKSARFWIYGVLCSMVPDVDVVGFRFGVRYGDMLGHRGLTHSIAFAVVFSGLVTAALCRWEKIPWRVLWLYLFLATVSHGVLDALTDGGLGVAFFAPFSNTRYFFPWTPIEVSPIGANFFSARGREVIYSEMWWIWLPSAVFALVVYAARKMMVKKRN